jgi:hypothetical protein
MARWLDGSMTGSTARSMWLDGSMLTEDVFSLDALMPDSMTVLMPSSMQARCRLDAGSMQARCRLDASMPGLSQHRALKVKANRQPLTAHALLACVRCGYNRATLNVEGGAVQVWRVWRTVSKMGGFNLQSSMFIQFQTCKEYGPHTHPSRSTRDDYFVTVGDEYRSWHTSPVV